MVVASVHEHSASNTTARNLEQRFQNYPPYTCYKCLGSNCSNLYETCDEALQCFTHTSTVDNTYLLVEKGCYKKPFQMLAFCHNGRTKLARNETANVTKCCSGNLCNDDEFITPNIPDLWTPTSKIGIESMYTKEIKLPNGILPGCIAIFVFSLVLGAACLTYARRRASDKKLQNLLPTVCCNPTSTFNDTFACFMPSGSGSGVFTLNQRTFAQDVTLIRCIGHGRYGEVWQGMKLGEIVAVKIFSSRDEESWKNEVNIYTNISLCHENVLGFKGSTIASRSGVTEMWLLTSFHERGSLYDYLLENTVTHKQMIEFVRSACSGLLHLHVEIFDAKGKPGIAHRDLKTRNILITSRGTCVIADFGLAVIKGIENSSTDVPINYRVGTKRYMAPEVLDESMNLSNFESFKRTDIYAFGLIMWEVCSRCVTDGVAEAYRPPYDGYVPNNPDFEDMKKVVCIESKRPEIPDRWLSDEPLDAMAKLMKLCWHEKPEVRYTSYRVLKSLDKIRAQIQEQESSAQCV
ncbi:Activin receptor type-1 like protein [Argiope bruennichi]|uniref:receptor protein serine/threonine kinase n=1 Tax=Argiope bruennichi TaxID=94029 RepID=A0A8T0FRM4_ARGBR|nr:Activin receptor type-1 like protein [Argiope bruennichi]